MSTILQAGDDGFKGNGGNDGNKRDEKLNDDLNFRCSSESGKSVLRSLPGELAPHIGRVMTSDTIPKGVLKRKARLAKRINDIIGDKFEVTYQPDASFENDADSRGHLYSVFPTMDDWEIDVDDRENAIEDCAKQMKAIGDRYMTAYRKLMGMKGVGR